MELQWLKWKVTTYLVLYHMRNEYAVCAVCPLFSGRNSKELSVWGLRLCLYDIMSCASVGCPTASGPLVHTHLFESHSMTDPYSENERNKEMDSIWHASSSQPDKGIAVTLDRGLVYVILISWGLFWVHSVVILSFGVKKKKATVSQRWATWHV